MRNEIVTSKIFQRERVILCSYLTTWQRKKTDWKNVDDMSREFVKAHEENKFFLKNIANSLRRLNNDDDIEMFDLSLNFEK
jgi:viroplasmin and RNaseH domain-containing protein